MTFPKPEKPEQFVARDVSNQLANATERGCAEIESTTVLRVLLIWVCDEQGLVTSCSLSSAQRLATCVLFAPHCLPSRSLFGEMTVDGDAACTVPGSVPGVRCRALCCGQVSLALFLCQDLLWMAVFFSFLFDTLLFP